ncbi:unnamed protein product [Meloidogyne enterolobii]|uniref:Uncharacterized protein n=1 Tax=Meloidogyne enterolobii TaxID=390850 RepID=A0ACB0YPS0_MELEN
MATADNHCCYYILKLPTIPKNIEEMIIVRCWLERLLTCSFDHCIFNKIVFNREMLNILFETPPKFHVNKPSLSPNKNTFENMLDFIMNHLANTSFLAIKFIYYDNAEQYINILFNILINEGDKFPRISLRRGKLTRLYELIVEVN